MTETIEHDLSEQQDGGSRLRLFVYLLVIAVTAGISAARIVTADSHQSANDRSRWCTVWSLVERGTYQIDEIDARPSWTTIDKVRHEQHFYSTKPPLFPTLVAGVYWMVKTVTGWNLEANTANVTRSILLLVNLLPTIVALMLIARIGERYARSDITRVFLVVTASLATLLTPFLVALNNHTVAAVAVVLSLYPAMRILADGGNRKIYFACAGFFAACVCTVELPAAVFGLALFGLLFHNNPRQTLQVFVPAALVPLIAFFVTNSLATGGWKPFYLYYGTEKYNYIVDGVPSYWMNPKGIDANDEGWFTYFLNCTVGHHGILSLSPVYLLTLISWSRIRRWERPRLETMLWLGLGLTAFVLIFYLTRTKNYNYGGNTSGLRWMFWLIPFWLIGMIPVLDAWGDRRGFRLFSACLLAVSAFSATYPGNNPWRQPWLQTWVGVEYHTDVPPFDPPLSTWFPALPPLQPDGQPAWIEFAGPGTDGQLTRLRLSTAGEEEHNGKLLRRITVEWNRGAADERVETYLIDADAFNAGAPPAGFLRWPDGKPPIEDRKAASTFFRGLPLSRAYIRGGVRYLKTPLQKNAFKCNMAASRVPLTPPGADNALWYRADLWLSAEVPFGVLQIDFAVYDPKSRATVATRRLTAVATSGTQ